MTATYSQTVPVGRFAPSPTGPVHPGTLAAAMASYLDIKVSNGRWLLRIDDIDQPREIDGAAHNIQRFLEKSGFAWDGPVVRQTDCIDIYQEYLQKLDKNDLTYRCRCSRKQLGDAPYPGNCRDAAHNYHQPHAIRLRTEDRVIGFDDRIVGNFEQNVQQEIGDFVIFRKDRLFAYQFAVVIDDEIAGVTQVTRGMDLLDSTPRQIYLQNLLEFSTPRYAHLPLLLDKDGQKFSKSSLQAFDIKPDRGALVQAWNHLQSINVSAADFATIDSFWSWAVKNWQTDLIKESQQHV